MNGAKAELPSPLAQVLVPESVQAKASADLPLAKPVVKSAKDPSDESSLVAGQPPLLAFSEVVYESATGKEVEIKMTGENFEGATSVATELVFNPLLVKYIRSEPGSFAPKDSKIELDEARGSLRIKLDYPANSPVRGNNELVRLVFKGERPGLSYIVYREPSLYGSNGMFANVQTRASRIVVK